MSKNPANFAPETQKQRWIKYGTNVALTIIIVVVLACLITYLSQRFSRRVDTTATGIYSLRPQTVNLIKDLKQKITLVSLYQAKDAKQQDNPYAGPVRDLLEEYARKGKNIDFEVIDPVTQPTKTDNLVSQAVAKYGGAVKAYKGFIDDFDKTAFPKLKELTGVEAGSVGNIQTDNLGEDDRAQTLAAIIDTVRDKLPQDLTRLKERTDRSLKVKFPDYKAAVDRIKDSLDALSQTEAAIVKFAGQYKSDTKVPEAIRAYLAESAPRHEEIKKLADEAIKKIDTLGELKIGELQQAMKDQNLVLVLGENDWRVINPEQVWVNDARDARNNPEGQALKPRFAGEQAVTTAILSLTSGTKPKVAFVRPGGPPLATPGFPPFQRGGPLSELAERLRGYNFEVLEKDLSGSYAMQAQMQGMPPSPEPSDEDLKNAVWVVIDAPADQRMGPAPSIAPKLAEHLKSGGAAMVLALPQSDNLAEALKDYGLELSPDAVIVHDVPKGDHPRSNDLAEEAQWLPFVFVVNKYGDQPLAAPLRSLDALLIGMVPVKASSAPGVKSTPLLPIPPVPTTWGERDIESISTQNLKFDPSGPNPDIPGPLYAGATAEKEGAGRLIVIGGFQPFTDTILSIRDDEMRKRGILAARFPGNGELFTNAIFWLAKMEPMIAISPAAMEVSRIAPMDDAALAGWRVGVLLILLPGLVLAAGIAMYYARRD